MNIHFQCPKLDCGCLNLYHSIEGTVNFDVKSIDNGGINGKFVEVETLSEEFKCGLCGFVIASNLDQLLQRLREAEYNALWRLSIHDK